MSNRVAVTRNYFLIRQNDRQPLDSSVSGPKTISDSYCNTNPERNVWAPSVSFSDVYKDLTDVGFKRPIFHL